MHQLKQRRRRKRLRRRSAMRRLLLRRLTNRKQNRNAALANPKARSEPTMAGTLDTLLDRSALQVLLGSYAAGNARALLNPFLQVIAQEYRRSTGARMVALDKPAMTQKLPDCDYFA